MARLQSRPEIILRMQLELSEVEVRALEVLVSYDIELFLKTFYGTMGKAYLEKHEDGVRSLFEVRSTLNTWLRKIDMARKSFEADK